MTKEEIEQFVRTVVRGAQHITGERRREEHIVEQITDRWQDSADDLWSEIYSAD